MEAMGVPGSLLPIVIATEILGALAIIVGYQTRIVAFLLAGFSLVSAILFHFNFADQMQIYAILQSPTTGVLLVEQCPLFRLYYNDVQVGKGSPEMYK